MGEERLGVLGGYKELHYSLGWVGIQAPHDSSKIFPSIPASGKIQAGHFLVSTGYRNAEEGTSSFTSLLTHRLQVLGYFPPYTLSNVVLISCDHRKTSFSFFFFPPGFHAWIALQESTGDWFDLQGANEQMENKCTELRPGHVHGLSNRQCAHRSLEIECACVLSSCPSPGTWLATTNPGLRVQLEWTSECALSNPTHTPALFSYCLCEVKLCFFTT